MLSNLLIFLAGLVLGGTLGVTMLACFIAGDESDRR